MARTHLRDVCERISAASEVEDIVDALLEHLRAQQDHWHPTLAMVDGERDTVTRIWQRERGRLDRREVVVPVDHLPARMVRKFFRPSAFFNATERRSLLARVFRTTPVYEPDRFEAAQVQPLTAPVGWHSCLVLPVADRDDLVALLTLVSPKRNAFPAAAVEDVLALRSVAAVALARRLTAAGRVPPEARRADEQVNEERSVVRRRLHQLESESTALAHENRLKAERVELLAREMERVQQAAHAERSELEVLRQRLGALDEHARNSARQLDEAHAQLVSSQQRLNEQGETMGFLREVFEAAALEHDDHVLSRALVQRFCEAFAVDRCSLMRLDPEARLRIAAHRGLDPGVAHRVSVPLGHGVAGWVAHHRKPVLKKRDGDAVPVRATGVDRYNSESFVSVPLVHRNRVLGVLNLSNKRDGRAFDETDLDRALMASAVLSMAIGVREERAAATDDLREAA